MPVSEEELHAYFDDELPRERRPDVEEYLLQRPQERRRFEAYASDGADLARIFSHVGSAGPKRRAIHTVPWRQAAAVVLLVSAGAIGGWLGRGTLDDGDMTRLGYRAAAAHIMLNDAASRPLSVASLEELSRHLSAALGTKIELHDTASTGYTLVSGRLLPAATGQAAQLAFRGPDGQLITFYLEGRPGATETAFRHIPADGVTTVAWEDDNLACAISGAFPVATLEHVGHLIYDALLS